MKNLARLFSLLLLCFMVVGLNSADAQRRSSKDRSSKNDDYFDESGDFKSKLWYGGGLNLGFSGGNNTSVFRFGLSPMIGYKIMKNISVGPRVGFQYSFIKARAFNGEIFKVEPFDFSVGVFSRFKVLPSIFAHIEYEYESEDDVDPNNDGLLAVDANNNVIKTRVNRDNFYIGAGYNSGAGLFGYEILVLYNVTEPEDSFRNPFNIRLGFTYKF